MVTTLFSGAKDCSDRLARQFDVHRQPVGIQPGFGEQRFVRAGDGFEVDVAAIAVVEPERLRHPHQIRHGVVLAARDAGRQEQSLDAIAPVEIERQPHHLLDRKPRAGHVAGPPADAIGAIVDAEIGQQDLEQRNAAAVRRIGMADRLAGRADLALAGSPLRRARRGARHVVFRGVGENFELLDQGQGHSPILCSLFVLFKAGVSMVDTTDTTGSMGAASASSGAGAHEMQITPAMIEAGAETYCAELTEFQLRPDLEKLVQAVFVAMASCQKRSPATNPRVHD